MTIYEIAGYLCSVLIGISLGLIGGGGSILTVPILVYLFHLEPGKATSYSLFIVGLTALIGTWRHYKFGNLQLKTALIFAMPSVCSLLLMRKWLLPLVPDHLFQFGSFSVTKNLLIMVIFALLMIMASLSMIRKTSNDSAIVTPDIKRLLSIGFGVGMVTGFLGAGGGFLIIPALVFFAGLPMKQAVGTSLLIISINSMIGFGGDLLQGAHFEYSLLASVAAMAIAGMWLGTWLSRFVQGARLKPAFGWFVLVMGTYILLRELIHA